jgi:hypothetical protein
MAALTTLKLVMVVAIVWIPGRWFITQMAERYAWVRPVWWRVWRWRLEYRWYAPGATVWYVGDAPSCSLVVLAWDHHPACPTPWVLVHTDDLHRPDTDGRGRRDAVWAPLEALSPHPGTPPF